MALLRNGPNGISYWKIDPDSISDNPIHKECAFTLAGYINQEKRKKAPLSPIDSVSTNISYEKHDDIAKITGAQDLYKLLKIQPWFLNSGDV